VLARAWDQPPATTRRRRRHPMRIFFRYYLLLPFPFVFLPPQVFRPFLLGCHITLTFPTVCSRSGRWPVALIMRLKIYILYFFANYFACPKKQ
jgi:hypothetical protein